MTLLDRFAAVRAEIGIDQACNMLQTIELARKLLGVQVWSDTQSLPEQVCDVEDILGLSPPVETIATLPPGPARRISPPTHRTYTLANARTWGSAKGTPAASRLPSVIAVNPTVSKPLRAPSPSLGPVDGKASAAPAASPMRISARRAMDEMAEALREEEMQEALGA